MRCMLLASLLTILTLTTSAEEITTGNLVTNGNFETGNSNGWTTSGNVQVLSDCCELNNVTSNYDLEFGNSGSINQDFNLSSDTITTNMLDNGITLDSSIDAQNGECGVSGCWGGQGSADTFTNVLTIKDNDGNTLASNTTIRTDVTGINGAIFTDRLIYNGTGSSVGNIHLSGSDANAPSTLGGPNLDNISVTMTYDNTVIATEIVEEINNIFEEFEEITFEPMLVIMKEIPLEEIMEEEIIMEIEEMPIEEKISTSFFSIILPQEEEIYEETEEIITTFLPMVSQEKETFTEEKIIKEEEIMEEPKEMAHSFPQEEMVEEKEMMEEESEEIVEEEVMEEETTEMAKEEAVEEKPTKMVEATNEKEKEEVKEEKSTSETTKKSAVQTKKLAKQKKIQQKKAIVKNLDKIMDKVDKDIKDISKNLAVKNIIKMEAMTSEQASLDLYANMVFYKPENIYLDQLNIFDNRQLYPNTNLATYTQNDSIEIKARKLNELNIKKQNILIELEMLKNG